MGYYFEGVDEDRSNGADPCDDVQGSDKDSPAVWQRKLIGDGGDVEDPGGVSPPVSQIYQGDDGETCGRQEVVISPGVGGTGSSGLTTHSVLHLETTGNHPGTGDIPPHI